LRARLGRRERWAVEAFRGFFFDLDTLVELLARHVRPARILEIGCGEGALVERLSRAFPAAEILGIDPSPRVGRMFHQPPPRVQFECREAGALAGRRSVGYDLVVLCDVLHHVERSQRVQLLREARGMLSARGWLLVKDWENRPRWANALAYLSDRWLTGDRVEYFRAGELRALLESALGAGPGVIEARFPPRHNNVALLVDFSQRRNQADVPGAPAG